MTMTYTITEIKDAVIENVSLAGSAFATTKEGEAIFINSRITAMLKLQPLDEVRAFVLPNYEDKRGNIPWRAVRVERTKVQDRAVAQVNPRVEDRILAHMRSGGIFSNADLSSDLEIDVLEVGTTTARLFNDGKIVKAEVYRRPGQARASFLLYAINIEEFE